MAKKVSDKQFWEALRKCLGNFSSTARYLKQQHGVNITRQAVSERAKRQEDRYNNILEGSLDYAEENLFRLMNSKNESVAVRATIYFLKTRGKERGYTESSELKIEQQSPVITGFNYIVPAGKEPPALGPSDTIEYLEEE